MKGAGTRFRWTVALLGTGLLVGAYVDVWSRLRSPGALGPWGDALVVGIWFLLTAFIAAVFARNLAAGAAWREALPPGCHMALAGGVVFGIGALADVYYQIAFGPGQGMSALLAPTHLVELAGGGLLVAAPLSQALKDRPERASWTVVVAAALTLSVLTFLTLFANPLMDLWASARSAGPRQMPWVGQDLGVAAILIQVTVLTGVILLVVRSFEVPRGSLTVLCGLNGLCLAIASGHPELLWVLPLTGLAADGLLLGLRPQAGGTLRFRIFSGAVPAVYAGLYWAAIVFLEGGTAWPVQVWLGVLMAAALAGFFVSYVAGIRRPRSVVAAEEWAERWPERHVEVTPVAVKDALDALDDEAALAASPLAKLPSVGGREGPAGAELRSLLVDVVHELAAARAPRDAEAGRLLVDYYVKKVGSHEVIAERLHLSRPTFYRRLQRGLTLVAERLDELGEFAARHG